MPPSDSLRQSPSYRLPVEDTAFLLRDEMRGMRFALEYSKAELAQQTWADANAVHVIVSDGVIHLWGTVQSSEERAAVCVAAENAGGRSIEDHLVQLPALPPL